MTAAVVTRFDWKGPLRGWRVLLNDSRDYLEGLHNLFLIRIAAFADLTVVRPDHLSSSCS
jgi:hypothetical protein